jgi:outer membrane immunogenic protein
MNRALVGSLAITALLIAAPLSTATAADLEAKAPPPAPALSWTGFYVGGNVGGGWGQSNITSFTANDPASTFFFTPPPTFQPPPTLITMFNVLGGPQAGFNWQFARNWVIGNEFDFNWTGLKGSSTSPNLGTVGAGATDDFNSTVSERLDWFGTARIRLGYVPVSALMAYITGGFAYGRVDRTGNYVASLPGVVFVGSAGGFGFNCGAGFQNPCFGGSQSNVDIGWTAGGGFEYALTTNLSLKAEYLFVTLAGKSLTETAPFPAGLVPSSFNVNYGHTYFNVARVGFNFRF